MSKAVSKLEQIKSLKTGNGIQYLLDEAYIILGNPILMHDLDYKVMGLTENTVTDDPHWNELVRTGYHCMETIEHFRDDYLIDKAAEAKTVTILDGDVLKYRRIFGKVYNSNNVIVAGADVVECYKPFEDGDGEAFEAFCEKLSEEVSGIEFYTSYGMIFQEKLIQRLIQGDIEDKKLYPFHVAIIYEGLKKNLYLAVIDASQHDTGYVERCREQLKKKNLPYKRAEYAQRIVLIVSSDKKLNEKKDLPEFAQIFEENNVYAGISNCFQNLYDLQKYYKEAVNALTYGLNTNSGQRIFLYRKISPHLPG